MKKGSLSNNKHNEIDIFLFCDPSNFFSLVTQRHLPSDLYLARISNHAFDKMVQLQCFLTQQSIDRNASGKIQHRRSPSIMASKSKKPSASPFCVTCRTMSSACVFWGNETP